VDELPSGNAAKRRRTFHEGESADPTAGDSDEAPIPEASRATGRVRAPMDSGAHFDSGAAAEPPVSPAGPLAASCGDTADLEDGTSERGATPSVSNCSRLDPPPPARLLLPSVAADSIATSFGSRPKSEVPSDFSAGFESAPGAGASVMHGTSKARPSNSGKIPASAVPATADWTLSSAASATAAGASASSAGAQVAGGADDSDSDDEMLASVAGRVAASGDEGAGATIKGGGVGSAFANSGSADDKGVGGRGHPRGTKGGETSNVCSDDEPLGAGPLRSARSPLAASDSSGDERPDAQHDEAARAKESGANAGDADSDSDTESSSSSSSSSSESESDEEPEEPCQQELVVLDRLEKERRDLQVLRSAHLRRDDLVDLLLDLPEDKAESAVLRSFVRLTVQVQRRAQDACVLAEVVAIEYSPPYTVVRRNGDTRTLQLQIRCKRGSSTRLSKITAVSNQEVTETEFEQWKKLTDRTGVDVDFYIEQMKQKALDIRAAKNFTFDEAAVSAMLKKKPNLEFDSQKESRYRFLVQCALSQMDTSGIRDHEAEELEDRYKDALDKLHIQEAKSTQTQAEWFKSRPSLYSLKEINKKNLARQEADDRHALMYTMATETSGKEALNPFQRRACRPVVAWDTKLTVVEGLDKQAPTESAQGEAAAAPAQHEPLANNGAEQAGGHLAQEPVSRLESVLKAHKHSNLLSKLGSVLMTQTA